MLPGGLYLWCGGQGDAPGTMLQLQVEQRRAHGGFAMRCQFHAITLHEVLHPAQIVLDAALAQYGNRQADLFAQDVPAQAGNVLQGAGGGLWPRPLVAVFSCVSRSGCAAMGVSSPLL
jgi:hypothetical protein